MYVHQPTSDYKPTQMSNKKCSIIYKLSKQQEGHRLVDHFRSFMEKEYLQSHSLLLFDTSLAQNIM